MWASGEKSAESLLSADFFIGSLWIPRRRSELVAELRSDYIGVSFLPRHLATSPPRHFATKNHISLKRILSLFI
ncbi:MAG TPA: hypothetical protein ENJ56_00430 [Anaerolineae bacterium]|nr:hypothetical protein [Anaerolineae bacterium]